MNTFKSLIIFALLGTLLVANNAVIIEETDDPLEGVPNADVMHRSMGAEGAIIIYKFCMSDLSEDLITALKEESEYKNVTVVKECPADATAVCKTHPPYFKYYYTHAKRILDEGKEECRYLKGQWSTSTEGKEPEVRKYKGTVTIGEKHYDIEGAHLCSISPIDPNTIQARYQQSDFLIQIAAQQKDGKASYCMFDYIGKPKSIHAEGRGDKCNFTYDEKRLKGKISTQDANNFKKKIDITFDIECQ